MSNSNFLAGVLPCKELFSFVAGLLLVISIFILLRWLFLVRIKAIQSSDIYAHLNLIDVIRKNGHRVPKKFSQYEFNENTYPFFLHWVLSFFSKEKMERLEKYFGSIVDGCHIVLLYLFAFWLFNSLYISFLSSLIFLLTPNSLLFFRNRTFSISGRALSELLTSLVLIFIMIYFLTSVFLYLVICSLFIGLTLLTHRFGTQVIFLACTISTLVYSNVFLVALFFGFIFAIITSKGFYLNILKGHLGGFYYFIRVGDKHHLVAGESPAKGVWNFIRHPLANRKKLKGNKLMKGIVHTPQMIVLPYFGIYLLWVEYSISKASLLLLLWACIMPILTAITSFKVTSFLGEPERYLEYGAFSQSVLLSFLVIEHANYIGYSIMVFVIFQAVYLNMKQLRNLRKFRFDEAKELEKEELIEFLNGLPPSKTLCIPMNISHEIAYKTHHLMIFYMGTLSPSRIEALIEVVLDFPMPVLKICERKFNFDIVVVDMATLIDFIGKHSEYKNSFQFDEYEMMFETNSYLVYRK